MYSYFTFCLILIERLHELKHAQKLRLQVVQKGADPLPLWARIGVQDLGMLSKIRTVSTLAHSSH